MKTVCLFTNLEFLVHVVIWRHAYRQPLRRLRTLQSEKSQNNPRECNLRREVDKRTTVQVTESYQRLTR
jgi:hypothetical protein